MENENTVDIQDETQEDETLEVEEDESETDNGDDSNQHQDEVAHLKAENAKLQRLLNKGTKKKEEKTETKDSLNSDEVSRLRLEIKGYDDEQIDFLMNIGGLNALKIPAVKKVVDTMKEEKSQLQAQATSKSQGKSSKTYSDAEIKAMPVAKLEQLIREGKIK
jgi:hypothetical protein